MAATVSVISILALVVGSVLVAIVMQDAELGRRNGIGGGGGGLGGNVGGGGDGPLPTAGLRIPAFYPRYHPRDRDGGTGGGVPPMVHKLEQDLRHSPIVAEVIALDVEKPPPFLRTCGAGDSANGNGGSGSGSALERLEVLKNSQQPHLAFELLKYCALESYNGGLYIDSHSSLTSTLELILSNAAVAAEQGSSPASSSIGSLAVLNDPKIAPKSIHGALLYVAKPATRGTSGETRRIGRGTSRVISGMIQVLMTTNVKVLESSPLLLPKSLYDLIAEDSKVAQLAPGGDGNNRVWYLLQHTCTLLTTGQRQVTAPISDYALNSHRYVIGCILCV